MGISQHSRRERERKRGIKKQETKTAKASREQMELHTNTLTLTVSHRGMKINAKSFMHMLAHTHNGIHKLHPHHQLDLFTCQSKGRTHPRRLKERKYTAFIQSSFMCSISDPCTADGSPVRCQWKRRAQLPDG